MKEKSLSEKINIKTPSGDGIVFSEDVREAVLRLKKECASFQSAGAIVSKVDEIFGKELGGADDRGKTN